jgi:hypothetical protein
MFTFPAVNLFDEIKDKSVDNGMYYDPILAIALVIFYTLATSVEFTPNAKFIPY